MSRAATRAAIRDLIRRQPGGHNADLVENIVEHALKLLVDVEHRGDVRVIESAIEELGYAFKTFEPYAGRRKVTVFGSARIAARTGGVSAVRGIFASDGGGGLHGDHRGGAGHHARGP